MLRVLTAFDSAGAVARAVADQAGDEREGRRVAWAQATSACTTALANMVVVASCLLSSRSTSVLLEAAALALDDPRTSRQAAWTAASEYAQWHADVAALLFALRAGFGLIATWPALVDMQRLMLPKLDKLEPKLDKLEAVVTTRAASAKDDASLVLTPIVASQPTSDQTKRR